MARFDARTEAARAKSGASLAAEYEGQTKAVGSDLRR